MIQNSTAEFYDGVFTDNPNKWANVDRDYTAFKLVSAFVREPAIMLDYGCGNGHTLALFNSQWPYTKYVGVDISPVGLEAAKQRLPQGEYYTQMPDGKFDIITIMGVAEHFQNPIEQLRHLSRYLTDNGILYLEVPNCLSYSANKDEGFRTTHEGAGQIEWHWKRETWEAALQAAGYEIVKAFVGPHPYWEFIWVLRKEKDEYASTQLDAEELMVDNRVSVLSSA